MDITGKARYRAFGPLVYDRQTKTIKGLHLPVLLDMAQDRVRSRQLSLATFLVIFTTVGFSLLYPALRNPRLGPREDVTLAKIVVMDGLSSPQVAGPELYGADRPARAQVLSLAGDGVPGVALRAVTRPLAHVTGVEVNPIPPSFFIAEPSAASIYAAAASGFYDLILGNATAVTDRDGIAVFEGMHVVSGAAGYYYLGFEADTSDGVVRSVEHLDPQFEVHTRVGVAEWEEQLTLFTPEGPVAFGEAMRPLTVVVKDTSVPPKPLAGVVVRAVAVDRPMYYDSDFNRLTLLDNFLSLPSDEDGRAVFEGVTPVGGNSDWLFFGFSAEGIYGQVISAPLITDIGAVNIVSVPTAAREGEPFSATVNVTDSTGAPVAGRRVVAMISTDDSFPLPPSNHWNTLTVRTHLQNFVSEPTDEDGRVTLPDLAFSPHGPGGSIFRLSFACDSVWSEESPPIVVDTAVASVVIANAFTPGAGHTPFQVTSRAADAPNVAGSQNIADVDDVVSDWLSTHALTFGVVPRPQVLVSDANGNPISGKSVHWEVVDDDASQSLRVNATAHNLGRRTHLKAAYTDSGGRLSGLVALDTASGSGQVSIRAVVDGVASLPFSVTVVSIASISNPFSNEDEDRPRLLGGIKLLDPLPAIMTVGDPVRCRVLVRDHKGNPAPEVDVSVQVVSSFVQTSFVAGNIRIENSTTGEDGIAYLVLEADFTVDALLVAYFTVIQRIPDGQPNAGTWVQAVSPAIPVQLFNPAVGVKFDLIDATGAVIDGQVMCTAGEPCPVRPRVTVTGSDGLPLSGVRPDIAMFDGPELLILTLMNQNHTYGIDTMVSGPPGAVIMGGASCDMQPPVGFSDTPPYLQHCVSTNATDENGVVVFSDFRFLYQAHFYQVSALANGKFSDSVPRSFEVLPASSVRLELVIPPSSSKTGDYEDCIMRPPPSAGQPPVTGRGLTLERSAGQWKLDVNASLCASVDEALPQQPVLRLVDAAGNGMPGVPVLALLLSPLAAHSGLDGSVDLPELPGSSVSVQTFGSISFVTDAEGYATFPSLMLVSGAGCYFMNFSAYGDLEWDPLSGAIVFTEDTVFLPGPPDYDAAVHGPLTVCVHNDVVDVVVLRWPTPRGVTIGHILPVAPLVKAIDSHGNPIIGVDIAAQIVSQTAPPGPHATLSGHISTTDATGFARFTSLKFDVPEGGTVAAYGDYELQFVARGVISNRDAVNATGHLGNPVVELTDRVAKLDILFIPTKMIVGQAAAVNTRVVLLSVGGMPVANARVSVSVSGFSEGAKNGAIDECCSSAFSNEDGIASVPILMQSGTTGSYRFTFSGALLSARSTPVEVVNVVTGAEIRVAPSANATLDIPLQQQPVVRCTVPAPSDAVNPITGSSIGDLPGSISPETLDLSGIPVDYKLVVGPLDTTLLRVNGSAHTNEHGDAYFRDMTFVQGSTGDKRLVFMCRGVETEEVVIHLTNPDQPDFSQFSDLKSELWTWALLTLPFFLGNSSRQSRIWVFVALFFSGYVVYVLVDIISHALEQPGGGLVGQAIILLVVTVVVMATIPTRLLWIGGLALCGKSQEEFHDKRLRLSFEYVSAVLWQRGSTDRIPRRELLKWTENPATVAGEPENGGAVAGGRRLRSSSTDRLRDSGTIQDSDGDADKAMSNRTRSDTDDEGMGDISCVERTRRWPLQMARLAKPVWTRLKGLFVGDVRQGPFFFPQRIMAALLVSCYAAFVCAVSASLLVSVIDLYLVDLRAKLAEEVAKWDSNIAIVQQSSAQLAAGADFANTQLGQANELASQAGVDGSVSPLPSGEDSVAALISARAILQLSQENFDVYKAAYISAGHTAGWVTMVCMFLIFLFMLSLYRARILDLRRGK